MGTALRDWDDLDKGSAGSHGGNGIDQGFRESVLRADGPVAVWLREGEWPQSVHWPVSELGLGSQKMGLAVW